MAASTPVTPEIRRQEDQEFKAILSYISSSRPTSVYRKTMFQIINKIKMKTLIITESNLTESSRHDGMSATLELSRLRQALSSRPAQTTEYDPLSETDKTVQRVRVLAATFNDLSSAPSTHRTVRKEPAPAIFPLTYVCVLWNLYGLYIYTHTRSTSTN